MEDLDDAELNHVVSTLGIIEDKSKRNSKKNARLVSWLVVISAVSFGLTAFFGMLSHFILVHSSIAASIILVVALLIISIIFDILGMAVAAAHAKPILGLIKQNKKGAREALYLLKNAEKVSCFCCDVVGDICSILSGAAGAAITLFLVENLPAAAEVFCATFVSSFIAALSVFGKAAGKAYVINHASQIVLKAGKIISPMFAK